jgi:hypothetical protein
LYNADTELANNLLQRKTSRKWGVLGGAWAGVEWEEGRLTGLGGVN